MNTKRATSLVYGSVEAVPQTYCIHDPRAYLYVEASIGLLQLEHEISLAQQVQYS